MSEPAPKRSRTEEGSSSSLRIQVIQERLEKIQRQDIEMHHLDEVVNEENFYALEENLPEEEEEAEIPDELWSNEFNPRTTTN